MWGRNVFQIEDTDAIGNVVNRDADDTFDDILAGRNVAFEPTGTFVGNVIGGSRFRLGKTVLAIVLGIFLSRIALWQIIEGDTHRALADDNRTHTTILPADRGVIKDRNGIVLAWNEPSFRLIVRPSDLPETAELRAAILTHAATEVGGDVATMIADVEAQFATIANAKNPREAVVFLDDILLMEDIEYERALGFKAQAESFRGFTLELGARRAYLTDSIPTLSHVLGYTGPISDDEYKEKKATGYRRFDALGKQGIEKEYEALLRGTPGDEVDEVNARGQSQRTLSRRETKDGQDLTLTIDARLQQHVEYVLTDKLQAIDSKRASVVVTDADTGEILALVSYPSFDANLFTNGIDQATYSALVNDPNAPLFPRATAGSLPSGSTIKPMYAVAALIEGIVTPTTTFVSTGGLWVGNRFFPDYNRHAFGPVNVYSAIANSVNTYFYIIGGGTEAFNGLGLEKLMEWASKFGFGSPTGVDLPTESSGFLPSKAWKLEATGEPWYLGDTYNVSIGQGDFLVSPLQMNRATGVFATRGLLWTPHLNKDLAPSSTRIIPEEQATIVADAMRQTVVYGGAHSLSVLPVTASGKTGTAQWATNQPEHAWFTGFAPHEDPEVVITVVVESGGLSSVATPIARDILQWYFDNKARETAVDTAP